MNRRDYVDKLRSIIEDGPYKVSTKNPGAGVRRTLHGKIRQIELDGRISRQQALEWCPTFFQTPFLFGLPKIHKENCPLRPVVSQVDSVFSGLSKFIADLVKCFACDSPSYIKNSDDLKSKLLSIPVVNSCVFVSFDVESLFTNVPIDGVLDALKWYIEKNDDFPNECVFTVDELLWLTEFLLRNCYFEFDNRFFIQTDGVSMGSSLGPASANIFMNFYEFKTFSLASELDIATPFIWYRYVDDVFACWTHPVNQLPAFLEFLNGQEDSINFTMEIEEDGKIPFLDVLVSRNGERPIFSVYRKATHSNLYLHRSSCHPRSVFPGVIRSLGLRAARVCSDSTLDGELVNVKSALASNGYGESEVNGILSSLTIGRARRDEPTNVSGSIPFIPGISNAIKSKLIGFGINIALKPASTLSSLLIRKRPSPSLCLGSVYRIECGHRDCGFSYVGESSRPIDKRKSEHLRMIRELDVDRSELAKHVMDSGHRIDIDSMTVVDRERSWKRRIVKESLWTKHFRSNNRTKIDLGSFYDSVL